MSQAMARTLFCCGQPRGQSRQMAKVRYIDFESAYTALARPPSSVLTRSKILEVLSLAASRGKCRMKAKHSGRACSESKFCEADIDALNSEIAIWREVCSPRDQWLTLAGAATFLSNNSGHSVDEIRRQIEAAIFSGRFDPGSDYSADALCIEGCGIRMPYLSDISAYGTN